MSSWYEIEQSTTARKTFRIFRCTSCRKLGCTVDTASPPSACCCGSQTKGIK